MTETDEIADATVRQSGITSHAIGLPELSHLLEILPSNATLADYEHATVADNCLSLSTESGREWRFATLRRLYLLRPDSVLFRSLRALWALDKAGQPLLAGMCALATDTVFRATADPIKETGPGDPLTTQDFADAIALAYPDAYAESTLMKTAGNAYVSWEQTGHLGPTSGHSRTRRRAAATATTVAYALLLGHLAGHRGEALFETVWARVQDRSTSHLQDLAFSASQQGMLEFRNAGGVIEVGFRELLRTLEAPT